MKTSNKKLKYHRINLIDILKTKEKKSKKTIDKISATSEQNSERIETDSKRAGRFILATNVWDSQELSADEILTAYREQQAPKLQLSRAHLLNK